MPFGLTGLMSVALTSLNLYFTGFCLMTPSGSVPVHVMVTDGTVATATSRVGCGTWICVDGAVVCELNERNTGADVRPRLSIALTTHVWKLRSVISDPSAGNGFGGFVESKNRSTSLAFVSTHAVSPETGGSTA